MNVTIILEGVCIPQNAEHKSLDRGYLTSLEAVEIFREKIQDEIEKRCTLNSCTFVFSGLEVLTEYA